MTTSVGDASADQQEPDATASQSSAVDASQTTASNVADAAAFVDGTTLNAAPTASYATNVYPYNCICYMTMSFPGVGTFRGSAVIIGPHTILTAAHCLWEQDALEGASNIPAPMPTPTPAANARKFRKV